MNEQISFAVVGGDLRSIYAAEALARVCRTYAVGFDRSDKIPEGVTLLDDLSGISGKADYILLPLPVSRDGINVNAPFCCSTIPLRSIPPLIRKKTILFGGNFNAQSLEIFKQNKTVDYFQNEELNILNAAATAEGAVMTAIEHTDITLFGSNILVTGFGRIAKLLIKLLVGFGAKVTVSARKQSDLTWGNVFGCETVSIRELSLRGFDVVFNTVPEVILTRNILETAHSRCIIIDLASKPGGLDFNAAEEQSIKTIQALGLPGKTAPRTSGEIIAGVVLKSIQTAF